MHLLMRMAAFLLSVVFAFTSTVSAAPSCYEIRVPEEYGTVTQRYKGDANKPCVIHIQDAHSSLDAQMNIANILKFTSMQNYKSVVGVEGAAGSLVVAPFREFPIKSVRDALSSEFMAEGIFSGAEFAAITSDENIDIRGVEDPELFRSNLSLFYDASLVQKDVNEFLADMMSALDEIKQEVFISSDLIAFDLAANEYQDDNSGLLSFLPVLYENLESCDLDYLKYINLLDFKEIFILGRRIDYSQVQSDILQIRALVENQLSTVIQFDGLSEKGKVQLLQAKATEVNVETKSFKAFSEVAKYYRRYGMVDMAVLLMEVDACIFDVKSNLAKTAAEKELVQFLQIAETYSKVLKLEASRTEFNSCFNELPSLNVLIDYVKKMNENYDDLGRLLEPNIIDTVFDFYAGALRRDGVLLENLLNEIDDSKADVGVVVAGGFHSSGLKEKLRDNKISYVDVVPNITSLENSVPYHKKMTGEICQFSDSVKNFIQILLLGAIEKGLLSDDQVIIDDFVKRGELESVLYVLLKQNIEDELKPLFDKYPRDADAVRTVIKYFQRLSEEIDSKEKGEALELLKTYPQLLESINTFISSISSTIGADKDNYAGEDDVQSINEPEALTYKRQMIKEKFYLYKDGDALYDQVREVFDSLIAEMKHKGMVDENREYELIFYDSEEISASYYKDSDTIVMSRGLLDSLDRYLRENGKGGIAKDHIAGVLGHELEHSIQNFGSYEKGWFEKEGSSRKNEYDADIEALFIADGAGYSPRAFVDVMDFFYDCDNRIEAIKKMQIDGAKGYEEAQKRYDHANHKLTKYLGAHPASLDRRDTLSSIIADKRIFFKNSEKDFSLLSLDSRLDKIDLLMAATTVDAVKKLNLDPHEIVALLYILRETSFRSGDDRNVQKVNALDLMLSEMVSGDAKKDVNPNVYKYLSEDKLEPWLKGILHEKYPHLSSKQIEFLYELNFGFLLKVVHGGLLQSESYVKMGVPSKIESMFSVVDDMTQNEISELFRIIHSDSPFFTSDMDIFTELMEEFSAKYYINVKKNFNKVYASAVNKLLGRYGKELTIEVLLSHVRILAGRQYWFTAESPMREPNYGDMILNELDAHIEGMIKDKRVDEIAVVSVMKKISVLLNSIFLDTAGYDTSSYNAFVSHLIFNNTRVKSLSLASRLEIIELFLPAKSENRNFILGDLWKAMDESWFNGEDDKCNALLRFVSLVDINSPMEAVDVVDYVYDKLGNQNSFLTLYDNLCKDVIMVLMANGRLEQNKESIIYLIQNNVIPNHFVFLELFDKFIGNADAGDFLYIADVLKDCIIDEKQYDNEKDNYLESPAVAFHDTLVLAHIVKKSGVLISSITSVENEFDYDSFSAFPLAITFKGKVLQVGKFNYRSFNKSNYNKGIHPVKAFGYSLLKNEVEFPFEDLVEVATKMLLRRNKNIWVSFLLDYVEYSSEDELLPLLSFLESPVFEENEVKAKGDKKDNRWSVLHAVKEPVVTLKRGGTIRSRHNVGDKQYLDAGLQIRLKHSCNILTLEDVDREIEVLDKHLPHKKTNLRRKEAEKIFLLSISVLFDLPIKEDNLTVSYARPNYKARKYRHSKDPKERKRYEFFYRKDVDVNYIAYSIDGELDDLHIPVESEEDIVNLFLRFRDEFSISMQTQYAKLIYLILKKNKKSKFFANSDAAMHLLDTLFFDACPAKDDFIDEIMDVYDISSEQYHRYIKKTSRFTFKEDSAGVDKTFFGGEVFRSTVADADVFERQRMIAWLLSGDSAKKPRNMIAFEEKNNISADELRDYFKSMTDSERTLFLHDILRGEKGLFSIEPDAEKTLIKELQDNNIQERLIAAITELDRSDKDALVEKVNNAFSSIGTANPDFETIYEFLNKKFIVYRHISMPSMDLLEQYLAFNGFLEFLGEEMLSKYFSDEHLPTVKAMITAKFKYHSIERRISFLNDLIKALHNADTRADIMVALGEAGGIPIVKFMQILAQMEKFEFLGETEEEGKEINRRIGDVKSKADPLPKSTIFAMLDKLGLLDMVDTVGRRLGSASIKQVHEIKLKKPIVMEVVNPETGKKEAREFWTVAAKIKRPSVLKHIEEDFFVLQKMIEEFNKLHPDNSLSENILSRIKKGIEEEVDFKSEVDAQKQFFDNMVERGSAVRVPLVLYPEGISLEEGAELFVTFDEFAEGQMLKDISSEERPVDIDYRIIDEFLDEMFRDHLFHGDLHDGNVIIQEDGSIVFIDLGDFVEMSKEDAEQLLSLVESIGSKGGNVRKFKKTLGYFISDVSAFDSQIKDIFSQKDSSVEKMFNDLFMMFSQSDTDIGDLLMGFFRAMSKTGSYFDKLSESELESLFLRYHSVIAQRIYGVHKRVKNFFSRDKSTPDGGLIGKWEPALREDGHPENGELGLDLVGIEGNDGSIQENVRINADKISEDQKKFVLSQIDVLRKRVSDIRGVDAEKATHIELILNYLEASLDKIYLLNDHADVLGFSNGDIIAVTKTLFDSEAGIIALFHEAGEGFFAQNQDQIPSGISAHVYLRGLGKSSRGSLLVADVGGEMSSLGLQDLLFGTDLNDTLTASIANLMQSSLEVSKPDIKGRLICYVQDDLLDGLSDKVDLPDHLKDMFEDNRVDAIDAFKQHICKRLGLNQDEVEVRLVSESSPESIDVEEKEYNTVLIFDSVRNQDDLNDIREKMFKQGFSKNEYVFSEKSFFGNDQTLLQQPLTFMFDRHFGFVKPVNQSYPEAALNVDDFVSVLEISKDIANNVRESIMQVAKSIVFKQAA